MDKIQLRDLGETGLLKFGNSVQVSGVIYTGEEHNYIVMLPDEYVSDIENSTWQILQLSPSDWERLLRQTDILETVSNFNGTKAIVRKSQRQIDSNISWRVYRRDGYTCRYCGRNDVPLTVDHIILWEDGGPTIEENLLCACRACNKARGNMQYDAWLGSESYKQRVSNLTKEQQESNIKILERLEDLRQLRVSNQRSR